MNPLLTMFSMLAATQASLRKLAQRTQAPAARRHMLAARSEVLAAEITLLTPWLTGRVA